MISTTCRDECPAGSSVSAGTGPRGPGGGDGGTAAGFGLAVFLFAGSGLGLGVGLGFGVRGFGAALLGSLVYSVIGLLVDLALERLFPQK